MAGEGLGRAPLAFVHRGEAFAQLLARRQLEGHLRVGQGALGAHDALRDRRLGHEEGARDLVRAQAAEQAQADERVGLETQALFKAGPTAGLGSIERVLFPTSTEDVPDRPALTLAVLGTWIVWSAVRRLVSPPDVQGGIVLAVALAAASNSSSTRGFE